jgi:hypothetical protein
MPPTCAEALKECVKMLGGVVTTREAIDCMYRNHPEKPWTVNAIQTHTRGCSVNHPSSHRYPYEKFLFTVGKGTFRLYAPSRDGIWVVDEKGARNVDEDTIVDDVDDEPRDDATMSLERDLEQFICDDPSSIEEDLRSYKEELGRQFSVKSGSIDILAQDKHGDFVVIELKAGHVTDSALTQLLSYMADVKTDIADGQNVRGVLIGYRFSEKVIRASTVIPEVELKKYRASFKFEKV